MRVLVETTMRKGGVGRHGPGAGRRRVNHGGHTSPARSSDQLRPIRRSTSHTFATEVSATGGRCGVWFHPATAALAEVPLDDRQRTLLFHARTSDFQDVTVQATVTYRVVVPTLAAKRIAFDMDPQHRPVDERPDSDPRDLLRELAQQPAIERVATILVTEALAAGVGPIRAEVAGVLADDRPLSERGLAVTDVRVVAVRADSDLKAGTARPTYPGAVQQEADKATFDHSRDGGRGRGRSPDELQSRISSRRREETLVNQVGQDSGSGRPTRQRPTASWSSRRWPSGAKDEAKAEGVHQVGEAQADVEEAEVRVLQSVDRVCCWRSPPVTWPAMYPGSRTSR